MLPSIIELHDILYDADAARRYLIEKDVFYHTLPCPGCSCDMQMDVNRWSFRCPSKRCRRELSMNTHTFFSNSRLKINQILLLGYFWLNGLACKSVQLITGISKNTITTFYSHFRVLVASTLDEEKQKIGGPGIVVEIDETKLGKRKYNKGHRVEGVWIVAGVERTKERRVFLVAVENRNAETLMNIIRSHVLLGSIVFTDGWRGYIPLEMEPEYDHLTVNHTAEFVGITEDDIEEGWVLIEKIHTNTIEGTNFAIKRQIPIRSRVKKGIEGHLSEFVWRRLNMPTLWDSFIAAFREVHYEF